MKLLETIKTYEECEKIKTRDPSWKMLTNIEKIKKSKNTLTN